MPEKSLETIECAPAFDRLSRSAVEYAIEHGAAKLSHVLSEASLERLRERKVTDIELALHRAPELQEFIDLFDIGKARQISRFLIQHITRPAGNKLAPHIDEGIVLGGIDLLLPLSGPEAVFGADNQRWSSRQKPSFLAHYGPGSGVILRQRMRQFQGEEFVRPYAWHAGYAAEERTLMSVCHSNVCVTLR